MLTPYRMFDQHQFSIVNQLKHLFISLSNNGLITVVIDSNCNSYSQYLMTLFAQHSLFKLNIKKEPVADYNTVSILLNYSGLRFTCWLASWTIPTSAFCSSATFTSEKRNTFNMLFSQNRQCLHDYVFLKVFCSKKRNEAFFFLHCDFKVVLINS